MLKKTFYLIIFLSICFVLVTSSLGAKIDPWEYNRDFINCFPAQPYSAYVAPSPMPALLLICAFISLCDIGIVLFSFIRGKLKNNSKQIKLGVISGRFTTMILISEIILIIKMFESISNTLPFFAIPAILQTVLAITVLVFSIKNSVLSGKIYGAISILVIICMIFPSVLPMFQTTRTMGGVSMQLNSVTDSAMGMSAGSLSSPSSFKASNTIGFSVGGAKDINNFRENIKNGFLPLLSDVTYEGLFYDYYFDTGKAAEQDEMFYNELWQCRWDRGTAIRYLTDFFRAEKFIGFVLEHEGRIVAAMFCREKVWWNNSELVIEEMFVRPECQRQGFGTALLQKAEEYVIDRGLAGITLATNRCAPAPAFYKKNGFFECEHVLYMGKAVQPNPDQQTS